MEEVNQIQRAALAWNVLIGIAKDSGLIQYKALGDQIGIHHRAVRFVLAVIQKYCLENYLPPSCRTNPFPSCRTNPIVWYYNQYNHF